MWMRKDQATQLNTPDQPEQNHGGDYAVKRSKRTDLVARILAILAAILLWIYVSTTNSTTEEQTFSLVPVTYREESILKNEYGLIVQSINIDTLNVTLEGLKNDVRSIAVSDVKAYVNLGGITEAGEYTLDVYVDVPSGTTCVSKTVDKVVVSVDRPSTKDFPLSTDKVELSGWSLDKDCFFGDISLSSDRIVLEGPTLELEKIADIKVRTDMIGSANASFTATASVHFIDAEGDEIVDSGVNVQGDNILKVSVEVLKKMKVELKIEGKEGILSGDRVTLTPAYAWLTGEPEALEGKKEWIVGSIDETTVYADTTKTYPLALDGCQITDDSGEAVTSVSVVIKGVPKPVLNHTLTDLPVLQGETVVGYVSMNLTASDADDAEKLKTLTSRSVTVYLPVGSSLNTVDDLLVSFEKEFLTVIDEYDLYGYRGAT